MAIFVLMSEQFEPTGGLLPAAEKKAVHGIRYWHKNAAGPYRLLFLHGIWMPPPVYAAVYNLPADIEVVSPYIYGAAYLKKISPVNYEGTWQLLQQFLDEIEITGGQKKTLVVGHSAGGLGAVSCLLDGRCEAALALSPALNAHSELWAFYRRNFTMVTSQSPAELRWLGEYIPEFIYNLVNGYFQPSLIRSFCETVLPNPDPAVLRVLVSSRDELIRMREFQICYSYLGANFADVGPFTHGWPIFYPELFDFYLRQFISQWWPGVISPGDVK